MVTVLNYAFVSSMTTGDRAAIQHCPHSAPDNSRTCLRQVSQFSTVPDLALQRICRARVLDRLLGALQTLGFGLVGVAREYERRRDRQVVLLLRQTVALEHDLED